MSKRSNAFVLVAVAIVLAGGVMAIQASASQNDDNANTTTNVSADDVRETAAPLLQVLPYGILALGAALVAGALR
jgi:PBP1b-binding outer membrane lipoprotein LpoB